MVVGAPETGSTDEHPRPTNSLPCSWQDFFTESAKDELQKLIRDSVKDGIALWSQEAADMDQCLNNVIPRLSSERTVRLPNVVEEAPLPPSSASGSPLRPAAISALSSTISSTVTANDSHNSRRTGLHVTLHTGTPTCRQGLMASPGAPPQEGDLPSMCHLPTTLSAAVSHSPTTLSATRDGGLVKHYFRDTRRPDACEMEKVRAVARQARSSTGSRPSNVQSLLGRVRVALQSLKDALCSRFGLMDGSAANFVQREINDSIDSGRSIEDAPPGRCGFIVHSTWFDVLSGLAIFVNALFIGLVTQVNSSELRSEPSHGIRVMECLFCAFFTIELLIRLEAWRGRYFVAMGWNWGSFEIALVVLQLSEEFFFLVKIGVQTDMTVMRTLRALRLTRILRVLRLIRFVDELRTMVGSILSCMKSFLWTLCLVLMVIYLAGVYFTQVVLDYRLGLPGEDPPPDAISEHFSNLWVTMLSLYQAMSGGIDWGDLSRPLIDIDPLQGLAFAVYVAFMVLALTNVVTGVFVDGALKNAQREKDDGMVRMLYAMFAKGNWSNRMDMDTLRMRLQHKDMSQYLLSIEVDPKDAGMLGEMLAVGSDDEESINCEEFVAGCLKLRGNARATDIMHLHYDLQHYFNTIVAILEKRVDAIEQSLVVDHCGSRSATDSMEKILT